MKEYIISETLVKQIVSAFYELNAPVKTYESVQKALGALKEVTAKEGVLDTVIDSNGNNNGNNPE